MWTHYGKGQHSIVKRRFLHRALLPLRSILRKRPNNILKLIMQTKGYRIVNPIFHWIPSEMDLDSKHPVFDIF